MSSVRCDLDIIADTENAIPFLILEAETGLPFQDDDPLGTTLVVPLPFRCSLTSRYNTGKVQVTRLRQNNELFFVQPFQYIRKYVRFQCSHPVV